MALFICNDAIKSKVSLGVISMLKTVLLALAFTFILEGLLPALFSKQVAVAR